MTTTALTPDEIHAIGLAEVKRIRVEMEKVIASTGFKGTWDDFLKFTREDKRFFFEKPADRLMFYRDIGKRADAELPDMRNTSGFAKRICGPLPSGSRNPASSRSFFAISGS